MQNQVSVHNLDVLEQRKSIECHQGHQ